ncbi:hypothetical protein G3I15_20180, partial [Streptomyces sp. SID10244]|nr:hypothetical protein [Streptomyces sp. SID10244]
VLDELIGMFVNTLILRTAVDPAVSVEEFLAEVRAVDLDAFAHSDVAFEQLVDALAPERSTAHAPLTQIAFTYATDDTSGRAAFTGAGLEIEPLDLAEQDAKFDLTVGVLEHPGSGETPGLTAEFLYARALFDEPTILGFADTWLRVLGA